MRQRKVPFAAVAAGLVLFVTTGVHAQTARIQAGVAEGEPGQSVTFEVVLDSGGLDVVGTQNDITFAPETPITVGAQNRPSCTANPAIGREASQFAFQPPNCVGSGTCTGIRAIILSFSNLDPIPDGSVLYTCTVQIANDAPDGNYDLSVTGASSSDASGNALPTEGQDGEVIVSGGEPTAPVIIRVGSAQGQAGQTVSFDVTLETTAEPVGTQNDIAFNENTRIAVGAAQRPDCTVNPAIEREASQFAFQPPGCAPATTCTGIRAIILSFSNLDPIPNGATLYTCRVAIAEGTADGSYPLTCSGASSSDSVGGAIDTACTNGAIAVGGVEPTATATQPGEATPTSTPIGATPTSTVAGATATVTRTPTLPLAPTNTPGGIKQCDDGCAIVSPAQAPAGWLLLLPAAMLLWLRRRAR